MLDFFTAKTNAHLENWRLLGTPRVYAYLPKESECTYPGCGWDSFSQSGKLTGCPQCRGLGKQFHWEVTVLRARVVWGNANLNYLQPSPGAEIGDVYLGITRDDAEKIEQLIGLQRSYLLVDGKKVRPNNTAPNIVPGIGEGILVTCNLYTDPSDG